MDTDFAFDVELSVRYRDLDTLQHVNNAVYATYLEQARIEYFGAVLGMTIEDWELVLANVDVDFRRPVVFDDEFVRIECGVVDMGDSSFDIGYRVYGGEDDEPAATGRSVLVVFDEDGSRPIPDEWRDRIREFEPAY